MQWSSGLYGVSRVHYTATRLIHIFAPSALQRYNNYQKNKMPLKSRDYIDDLSLSASTNSVLDWGSLANSFVSKDGVSTLSNTKGETVTKEGEYLRCITPLC